MQRISQLVALLLLVVVSTSSSLAQAPTNTADARSHVTQPPQADQDAEVVAVLKQFLAHVSDPAMHEKFWADDLVYVSSNGKLRTKPEVVNAVRIEASQPAPPATSFAAEDISVRNYGSIAVVHFTLVAHEGPPAGPKHEGETRRFRNCGIFQHNHAGWQAVSWQSTSTRELKKK